MDPAVQAQLLALNRRFYEQVAEPFDATRRATPPGKVALAARLLRAAQGQGPVTLLDVGCGNGRFAWLLDEQAGADGAAIHYTGVDGSATLLDAARRHTQTLRQVSARLVQADLATADWLTQVDAPDPGFDMAVCLATLHHFPGFDLRARLLRQIASLVKRGGMVALSTWQFFDSARLAGKVLPWETIGLTADAVEPGDALLPWQQDVYAVRYVHQIDAAEVANLAQAAGLSIVDSYRADGKEGNLNLYTLFRRPP